MCILKETLGFGEGEDSNLEKEAEEDLEEEEGTFHPLPPPSKPPYFILYIFRLSAVLFYVKKMSL